MNPDREARFRKVIEHRQRDLTIILENVHDQHNIGAAMRSCDSVGIREIFVLYSEVGLNVKNITLGKRTSAGSRKWVDVHFYTDIEACFEHVRQQYPLVLTTHLSEDAKSLYELDLTQPIALLFGNEKDGVSEEVLKHTDGNFLIPQMGMTQSLNVSVAVAVSVYEAYRQRNKAGLYDGNALTRAEQQAMYEEFIERHKSKAQNKYIDRTNDQEMKKHSFEAEIQGHESGGAFVVVPFDVEEAFGKKRVKIIADFEGVTYRGSLVRMGTPDHILVIRKEIRQEIGKEVGDVVAITVEEDTKPRVVEVPDDLMVLLKKNPEAKNFFDQLSYTHQKEYVQWIEEAKRAATRENRMAKTIEMLLAGKKGK